LAYQPVLAEGFVTMPPALRRSRSRFDSDDDPEITREATPLSTAPNDAKRARLSLLAHEDDEDDEDEESEVGDVATTRRPGRASAAPSSAQRSRRVVSEDEDDIEEDEVEDVEARDRHPLSRAPSGAISMNRRPDADGSKAKRKHQPGAIVRIKVTNFVTYTFAEFFPGPNLNMVIGPNGTGKSSLVCAICLGLGWGPVHLGRAKEVSEFIKNGCREATIEIELQKAESGKHSLRNPVFTRNIKREGNKSTYFINGDLSNNRKVMTLAKEFSVQIDNLCQFLPQDRVTEFSQMSPTDLLFSTQRAVAPELVKHHENLCKVRDRQKKLTESRKQDKEQLKNYESRQEGQRLEVENTRRHAEVKQRMEWLEKCRPMTQYRDAVEKSRAAKELQRQLAAELQQLEKEVAPALRRVNEKEEYEKDTRALKDYREKDLKKGEAVCDKLEKDMEGFDDKLKEYDGLITAEKRSNAAKKREKTKIQGQILSLAQQIEEAPEHFDPVAINEEIRRKTNQERDLKASLDENRERLLALNAQGKGNLKAIEALNKRLAGLDTEAGKQLSKLERLSKDTHRAWEWVQKHPEEFQKPVYGPLMVECSVKDPKMVRAMEAFFQPNHFKIITVQCQQDFETCQRQFVREMKLHDFSVRVCSNDSLDRFRPPMPVERIQELGLDGWAIDHLEGPPAVIAMLCNEFSIHQNAIGLRDISEAQYQGLAKVGMQSFVAGGTSYRLINRAEYGEAGKSTSTRATRPPQIWTDQPVDGGLKAEIHRQINEKKQENSELRDTGRELKATITQTIEQHAPLEREIDSLKKDKAARQKAQVDFAQLPQQKLELEEKITQLDEFIEGVRTRLDNLQTQCEQAILQKAELAVKYAAAVSKLRVQHASLLEAELMHIEALSDYQTLKSRNEEIHNLLTTKRNEEKHAEKVAKEKKDAGRELVRQVKALEAEGDKLADEGNPGLKALFTEMVDKHQSPQGYSPEDLEADIDTIKADLELVQGGDQRVIDEYEKREDRIKLLREKLENSKVEDDEIRGVIHDTREQWEPELDKLVGIMSDKFSENFARIGCAGSVVVHKANAPDEEADEDPNVEKNPDGNGLDFANWAIHISVKFREAEPLSLLDSHRQSGGERAVSTIFYLMAMQSLSRAPFRVVDEINQGMDPRNERMVHGRMVDIAAGNGEDGRGGSQYFLVTPKLLNGLKYKPGMTVLCIVSGENMPAANTDGASRVDFRKLAQRARELGLDRNPAGRKIDSGVAMGSSFEDRDMYGDGDGEEGMDRRSMSRLMSVGA
jgi:structural maintenance of chromosomes protein 5